MMSDESHWLEALVGTELVAGSDCKTIQTQSLKGKHVALYFSAHWCPPCRGFTPLLASTYKQVNAEDGKELEIVYISRDSSATEFQEYFAGMLWTAVPFAKRDISTALVRKFGVTGIPSLLVFSPDGDLLTRSAVAVIRRDGDGRGFPWVGTDTVVDDGWRRIVKMLVAIAAYFLVTRWLIPEAKQRFAS